MFKHMKKEYGILIKIVLGVICFVFQEHIYRYFPLLFGLFLLRRGIERCNTAVVNGEAFNGESTKFVGGLFFIAVAIGILILRDEALLIAGMFWGITTMNKSGDYLNKVLYCYKHEHRIAKAASLAFVIEFVLAMILIFDTLDSIPHHILILGVELIVEALIEIGSAHRKKKFEAVESQQTE